MGARRPRDLLHRHEPRPDRSVRLRSRRRRQLRRLTNDAFADLQPAWSPDGRRIAFATDRFSTRSRRRSSIGAYRLALIDPATRRDRAGAGVHAAARTSTRSGRPTAARCTSSPIATASRTCIAWRSPSGDDRAGHRRRDRAVSGITGSSPALSVASRTGVAAFSVYDDGKYDIYTLDRRASTRAAGAAIRRDAATAAATLPPLDRRAERGARRCWRTPTFGLPPAPATIEVEPTTSAKLSLEGVGAADVAVGADRFGAAVGGGIGVPFSDMLGDHTWRRPSSSTRASSGNFSFKNTAAQVGVPEPGAPLELGPRRRAGAVPERRRSRAARHRSTASRRRSSRRSSSARPSAASRARRLSVQPRAARRVPGRRRRRSRSIRSSRRRRSRCDTGQLIFERHRGNVARRAADARHDVGGARLRHVDLRRDQPGAGAALPARGGADVRLASTSPACWPTTAATSCRCRSTRSPAA